jgi:hypothetical protein
MECSVCYSTNNHYHNTTNCGHSLCRICYRQLREKICPICRTEINQEIYKYNCPRHIPSPQFNTLKKKLETFITRRNFLQDCRGKRYTKYLNLMVEYANQYYYKGIYYPVEVICPYWEIFFVYSIQEVIQLYTHVLLDTKVPLELRRTLIKNIQDAIRFY